MKGEDMPRLRNDNDSSKTIGSLFFYLITFAVIGMGLWYMLEPIFSAEPW
jgi:hypothetical protein